MLNKKTISPVIAVALLLVVSVVAVVGYQSWYQGYQSILTSDIEIKSTSSGNIDIEYISSDGILYVTNSENTNISMDSVKISGVDCAIQDELEPGANKLDVSYCLSEVGKNDIIIVTNSGIIEESIFVEDVNIVFWFNDWNYRKSIALNSSRDLANFQVNLTIDTNSLITSGKMQSNCEDLRITTDDDIPLNYYIASGCDTTSTKVWVKMPSISIGENNIYLYYGNALASSNSNGSNVFEFFDDFEDGVLDTNKFTNRGYVTESGGELIVDSQSLHALPIGVDVNYNFNPVQENITIELIDSVKYDSAKVEDWHYPVYISNCSNSIVLMYQIEGSGAQIKFFDTGVLITQAETYTKNVKNDERLIFNSGNVYSYRKLSSNPFYHFYAQSLGYGGDCNHNMYLLYKSSGLPSSGHDLYAAIGEIRIYKNTVVGTINVSIGSEESY